MPKLFRPSRDTPLDRETPPKIVVECTVAFKEEIRGVASSCGLTMTKFVTQAMRYALDNMEKSHGSERSNEIHNLRR